MGGYMINKTNLWFLTLSSIILVLAIYYIAIPNSETSLVFSSSPGSEKIETNIQESEVLTAMRVTKEEEHLESIQTLQEILLNTSKSVDEKNEAYEQIQFLNSTKALEEKLENDINNQFSVSSFVELKENKAKIVIVGKKHSYSLANDIITLVNKESNNAYYVTVKFE